jgi:uncharacterized protein YceK
MKKLILILIMVFLSGCAFVGCATTKPVVPTEKPAIDCSKVPKAWWGEKNENVQVAAEIASCYDWFIQSR